MAKPTPVRGVHAATPMPEARAPPAAPAGRRQRHSASSAASSDARGPRCPGGDPTAAGRARAVRRRQARAGAPDRVRARSRTLWARCGTSRCSWTPSARWRRRPRRRSAPPCRVRKHLAAASPEGPTTSAAPIPRWQQDGIQALGRLEQLSPRESSVAIVSATRWWPIWKSSRPRCSMPSAIPRSPRCTSFARR
jgi:hypothetical protein